MSPKVYAFVRRTTSCALALAGLMPSGVAAEETSVSIFGSGMRIELGQHDVTRAALVSLGNLSAGVRFCVQDGKALELSKFAETTAGKPLNIFILHKDKDFGTGSGSGVRPSGPSSQPAESAALEDVTAAGCGMLRSFFVSEAERLREAMLGIGMYRSSLSLQGTKSDDYCPERDFVALCLRAATNLQEAKKWSAANGRAWREVIGQSRVARGETSNGQGIFELRETRFSDVIHLTCRFKLLRPLMCPGGFTELQNAISTPGQMAERALSQGFAHEWIFTDDRWRVFVRAQVDREGKAPELSLEKIGYVRNR